MINKVHYEFISDSILYIYEFPEIGACMRIIISRDFRLKLMYEMLILHMIMVEGIYMILYVCINVKGFLTMNDSRLNRLIT